MKNHSNQTAAPDAAHGKGGDGHHHHGPHKNDHGGKDTKPHKDAKHPHAEAAADTKTEPAVPAEPTKEAKLQDQLLRLMADFDNFRKRAARDRDGIGRAACESLISELLPVLDNMEMGLSAAASHGADKAFVDAYRMLRDQMVAALEKFDLKAVESAGKQFDPSVHEAVLHIESADAPAGVVVSEVRRGYTLGGKLLRASQVAVSRGRETQLEQPSGGTPVAPVPEGK